MLALVAALINFLAIQHKEELKENKVKLSERNIEIKTQEDLKKQDELNDIKTARSNQEIIKTFTSKLAEYGLHADSQNNQLKKIVKDSTFGRAALPYVEADVDGKLKDLLVRDDTISFKIIFENSGKGPANNVNVFVDGVISL